MKEYYEGAVKNYQIRIKSIEANNKKVYDIYNGLIKLSGNLIEVYDATSKNLTTKLEQQYNRQFSRINRIRRYTVLGLLLLLIGIWIFLAYFTKLSFIYEQKINEAKNRMQYNLKFKNRILGMLSHEIRSPLKIVDLFINRISNETTDDRINENLKSIRFTINSILIQAGQILDYTRNQEKEITINPSQFLLKAEIDSIFNIFQPYIESGNNRLIIKNTIQSSLFVWSDKPKIHQLFVNLLGNANKFTENGIINVATKTTNIEPNLVRLEVTISDTGAGISNDDLKKIFEPYYKGRQPEDVHNIGAGLGLNLCKEIIELFNGTISIKSKLGEGTTIHFKIYLTLPGND